MIDLVITSKNLKTISNTIYWKFYAWKSRLLYIRESYRMNKRIKGHGSRPITRKEMQYWVQEISARSHYGKEMDEDSKIIFNMMFKYAYPKIYSKLGSTKSEIRSQENIETFFKNQFTPKISHWF